MKRFFLITALSFLSAIIFAQTDATAELDFVADGITFTIIDPVAKTCATKSGSSSYSYESGSPKLITTFGNSYTGDLNLPTTVTNTIDGVSTSYTVVAIGEYAFNQLRSIDIPESVTEIGTAAFSSSASLTSVRMGNGVTSVGKNAFAACPGLSEVTLSNSLSAIPSRMFANCTALKNVLIPASVTSIGEYAFSGSGITELFIPPSVSQISNNAFSSCHSLASLQLPEGLQTIPAYAFSYCNSLPVVTIPASVTSIGESAFGGCTLLKEVTSLSKSLPAISPNSFGDASFAGKLMVYNTAISAYKKSPIWGKFTSIEPIYVAPTGITIDKTSVAINLGFSQQLKATLVPDDALGEIKWEATSTPENAVSVTETGKVLAQRIGQATVTATCNGFSANCQVTVWPNSSESVTISPLGSPLYVGDAAQLSAVVIPSTIISPVTWASSNEGVASVDPSTGQLKAIAPGGTLITATCEGVVGKLSVTVNPIAASSVTLDKSTVVLKAGQTATISATVSPANTTYPEVAWETSDPNVALVSGGVVTATGVGSCIIRASCGEAIANCEITVEATLPESISLSETALSLKPGQKGSLIATVMPETTTDKTIYFYSSNPNVVSVSTDGLVTALSIGNAVITASCGDVSTTCNVTVEPVKATEIVLNFTSLNLMVNQVSQLVAMLAEDVTDKTIIWTSSDRNVATVEDGLVTAIGVGTAEISAANGDVSATCLVSVSPIPVESISLNLSELTLEAGNSSSLSLTISPANATDPAVAWDSSNPGVATVAEGMVTAVAPGTAIITASCQTFTASCLVSVVQHANELTLNYTQLTLELGDSEDIIATVSPASTTDPVIWTSSDPAIVSVDEYGIVSALAVGQATITAACGQLSASCVVTITPVAVEKISLNASDITLNISESFALTTQIYPENASINNVVWKSSDPAVATVTESGVVKAVSAGVTTVTASIDNISAVCKITVLKPDPKAVVVNYSQLTLHATETFQLSATLGGESGNYKFSWNSSDSSVASVDANGNVTALKPGVATITVSYEGESATCEVTVETTLASIVVLNMSDLNLKPGETYSLVASVYPVYTTDQSLIWTSSNSSVASVDQNGLVTAIGGGTAAITVYCGDVFSQCIVTVASSSSDENPDNNGGNGSGNNGSGDNGSGDNGSGDNGSGDNGSGDNGSGDNGSGDNGSGDDGSGDNGSGDNGSGDDGDGIEEIIVDNSVYHVFTINGHKVMTTKDKNQLNTLSSGLYIINGQKVMVQTGK